MSKLRVKLKDTKKKYDESKIILSMDRQDYTKRWINEIKEYIKNNLENIQKKNKLIKENLN